MRGIVFDGEELRLVEGLEVREPGSGEVTVQIVNAGVCHSDVSVIDGTIPFPTPLVMGHEGAGIITEIGSAVESVNVGDHVVLSTLGQCGACPACDAGRPTMCRSTFGATDMPFTLEGEPHYNFANVSSFCESVVVKANQAVRVPEEIPLSAASLIGCGVLTGSGAVFNRARVEPGESVAVLGVGGIGLNAIQAAALSGAHPVIAVDTNPDKADLAAIFGATDFVNAGEVDANLGIRAIRPTGVDYVFECVGAKTLIEAAVSYLDWGGTLVILGVPPLGSTVEFVTAATYLDVTIMGCRYGTSRPQADIARICELYLAGRFKLDELVTQVYPMEGIHTLLEDMHNGRLARGVLDVSPV
ncbi:MAG: Zn-dependent alcohol dehydrogenase [Actinomycetota bacterium]|nr:Zn-dependent alcohol dehydrogenase [Actinomycetota bacterium]